MPLYDNAQMWLGSAVMAALPLYLAAQFWFVGTWRGGWRIAALAPLVPALPAFAWAAYGMALGSNLAPLPLILVSPLCLLYLAVAWSLRRLTHQTAA